MINAFRGILCGISGERNFRIHICAIVYVSVFMLLGRMCASDVAKVCVCFGLVCALELVNSAIERICDFITEEKSAKIRIIKDMAAGAVLLAAVASVAVAICVFLRTDVMGNIAPYLEKEWFWIALTASIPIAALFVFRRKK